VSDSVRTERRDTSRGERSNQPYRTPELKRFGAVAVVTRGAMGSLFDLGTMPTQMGSGS
jgi:hypothetical protein